MAGESRVPGEQNPFTVTGGIYGAHRLPPDDYARAAAERDKTFDALLVFIEWRHKIMVRFMLMVAGLFAAWHYLGDSRWQMRAVVLGVGAAASATMGLMEVVNAGLIGRLYERGAQWEYLMFNGVGVFGAIRQSDSDATRWPKGPTTSREMVDRVAKRRCLSYGVIVRVSYFCAAAALAAALVLTLVLRK